MDAHDGFPFASPFFDVLHTNFTPNPTESNEIRRLLQQPKGQLAGLTNRIAKLEETLATLMTERDCLQKHIDDHLALLSPIRQLPEEVIEEIFFQCLESYPIRSTKEAPLLLTRICRAWRTIALTTPRLWSSIHIFMPFLKTSGRTGSPEERVTIGAKEFSLVCDRREGIKRWLDRSGAVPITFSLAFSEIAQFWLSPHQEPVDRTALSQSIITTFAQYHTRWKDVRFTGVDPHLLSAPLQLLTPADVSQLESLNFHLVRFRQSTDGPASSGPLQHLESLLRAPRLHRLHISTPMRYDLLELPIRWQQMTELCLRPMTTVWWSVIDTLKVLTYVKPTIQKFWFWVEFPTTEVDYMKELELNGPIQLSTLKLLSLTVKKPPIPGERGNQVTCDSIRSFLSALSCPSLEDLELSTGPGSKTIMLGCPVGQLLEQSRCTLKSFATDIPLYHSAMVECFTNMPHITTLTYHSSNSDPAEFGAAVGILTPWNEPPTRALCPSLQNIFLSNVDPRNAEAVTTLVTRRLDSGNDFRALKVSFSGHTGEEYRLMVKGFRERGLRVRWIFGGSFDVEADMPEGGLPGQRSPWASPLSRNRTAPYFPGEY